VSAAALVLARAPSAGAAKPELAPLLDADRRTGLQALLIRRAAAWAAAAAPGAAYVAVEAPLEPLPLGSTASEVERLVDGVQSPDRQLDEVRSLLPPGGTAFAQEGGEPAEALAAAIARIGRGPLLIAGTDCPRLSAAHAAAALADLAAGCDVVVGATLEGGWYLAGLREPRPELLTVAPAGWGEEGGFELVLRRAAGLGAEVGMLRHERLLVTPPDAAALLADPLLPADLRAALAATAA
jgi:glycosyltransferase A (GT-A) superfamily protein (DUF2064 family)